MRLIDADAIPFRDELKRLSVLDHDKYITARTLEYMLEHAPTVEAVPVVRCRECKHHKGYNCDRLYGMQDAFMAMDDDYCSQAERKDDD